ISTHLWYLSTIMSLTLPRSPLFPYTTLFRSHITRHDPRLHVRIRAHVDDAVSVCAQAVHVVAAHHHMSPRGTRECSDVDEGLQRLLTVCPTHLLPPGGRVEHHGSVGRDAEFGAHSSTCSGPLVQSDVP